MATNSMSDEEAMLAKVAEDGNALASASDRWRNNTKVVLAVAAKRGCVPAADADTDDAYDCRRGGNKYDGWMPLKGGGEYDTDLLDYVWNLYRTSTQPSHTLLWITSAVKCENLFATLFHDTHAFCWTGCTPRLTHQHKKRVPISSASFIPTRTIEQQQFSNFYYQDASAESLFTL